MTVLRNSGAFLLGNANGDTITSFRIRLERLQSRVGSLAGQVGQNDGTSRARDADLTARMDAGEETV